MKINKKILITAVIFCAVFAVFGVANSALADTYVPAGVVVSTNLLPAGGTAVTSFSYTATIPANTVLKVQFGYDNAGNMYSADDTKWHNSAGTVSAFDTLSDGTHTIDLSSMGWRGNAFYYRMVFSSTDESATPALDSVTLAYTAVDGVYDTNYQPAGVITSTNLMPTGGTSATSFSYTATMPVNVDAKIQFSYDKPTDDSIWYDSFGTAGAFDTMFDGSNIIDLTGMGWKGPYFYYRIVFVSTDGVDIPFLDSITLTYLNVDGDYTTYNASGNFVSTNLLSGQSPAASIDSFDYTVASLPAGTTAKVQFSTDNSTWYNHSGTLDAKDTLSLGSHNISLSGLTWSGSTFYYKTSFTSDGASTPALDSVALNYSYSPVTAPSITLSPATSVVGTTATINGDVVATGNEDPIVTVYWGTADHPGTATGWDHSSILGSQGVAAFYKDLTSLTAGTKYYFTASAINSAGTSWPAASLDFTYYTDTVLTNGLVGLWHMNNNWNDATGVNNGTAHGDATFGTAKLGSYAGSFSSASSQWVDMSHSSTLDLTTHLTLAAWVKTSSIDGKVIYKSSDTDGNHQNYNLNVNGGHVGLFLNSYDYNPTSGDYDLAGNITIDDGNWHFIAATWQSSSSPNNAVIYVDGVKDNQASLGVGTLTTTTKDLGIGGGTEMSAGWFNGQIDETGSIMISCRVASVAYRRDSDKSNEHRKKHL